MKVYLDNAATTKIDERVLKAMMPYYHEHYGNASSIHFMGQENELRLLAYKKKIAKILNGGEENIVFTSSATEANNYIIKGIMRANKDRGRHLIVSKMEHPCVLNSALALSEEGFEVSYVSIDKDGLVNLAELKSLLRPDTVLVSIMMVNNEIGTIQKMADIAKLVKANGSYLHSDAVQAVPYLKIDIKKLGLDALSLSAHKFYGPTGVGLAYVDSKIKIKPLIVGGGQENGRRAGTYNMAGIAGFTTALELAYKERSAYLKKVKSLRDYFYKQLKKKIDKIELNGSYKERTPNNLNIMFYGVEGEAILMDLSYKGICVSTGSACSAQNLRTSATLRALGLKEDYLNSNIRFSFGKYNTKKEIDYTLKALTETVKRLRRFSPIK